MNFEILKQAGVGQQEFASLVGVSRVSVNNWVRQKNNPSKHLVNKCKQQLAYITVAKRLNLLPGDIPSMHKSNVDSRREYIHAKLDDAALKIKELRKAQK